MSSNQLDSQTGTSSESASRHATARRRTGGRWRLINFRSLRVQLLAIFIMLFAMMSALVGSVTVLMLHSFQVHQLDQQLDSANMRFTHNPPSGQFPGQDQSGGQGNQGRRPTTGSSGSPTGNPADSTDSAGASSPTEIDKLFYAVQSVDTIAARVSDGKITAGILVDQKGAVDRIAITDTAILATLKAIPVDNQPRTRELGKYGQYRLVATQQKVLESDSTEILITGLPMNLVQESRLRMVAVEVGVGIAALLIAAMLAAGVIRLALAPLTRVAATARRVSKTPLHEGEVAPLERVPHADTDPRSEVGQVGAALNRMLGHIGSALAARQASETQLRQFIADASHELRTPLAAIRGYAELTHRHRMETPMQVGDALDRVEAAARRMTTLVEDLLLLARLDAKRPLAMEQVDLSAMVVEAITDAHVAGTGHRWLLDLPEESVTTLGDSQRLHQVLANLLANARTHTPPGTTVTVSLADTGQGVAMRVMDNGPGIPERLQGRLFERFARGDGSRSRATGSTGLGLAIVQAVVAAHNGTVEVSSVPGCTAFVVWLPNTGNSQQMSSSDTHSEQASGPVLSA